MITTIAGLQGRFEQLYGRRNIIVDGSFAVSALHVLNRGGKLNESKRTGEKMPGRLARAVAYLMNLINHFNGHLDLELGLLEKFPMTGCLYCGHMPCDCTLNRPDPTLYVIHDEQRRWTLRQWQQHFQNVYGHFNAGKFEKCLLRFMEEFAELAILVAGGPDTPNDPEEFMAEARREAADAFNRLVTVAYVEGIDLEQEVVDRYERCPGCGKEDDCKCDLVFLSEDGRRFSRVGTPAYPPRPPGITLK